MCATIQLVEAITTTPFIMKYLNLTKLIIASLLTIIICACQTKKKESRLRYNAETFVPTYTLNIPENWTTERFSIPIDFAPSIPYNGIEELRFAPGWANATSEDYWTYSYLWFLDEKITFDAKTVADNLEAYYTGLVDRNIDKRKIQEEKVFPVKATFALVESQAGDLSTFKGSVHMLDYMAQQPITLNFIVHVKECPGKNNTFVFYEVSPQAETHTIWRTLNRIWTEFECDLK
jgi:hypothetical protein